MKKLNFKSFVFNRKMCYSKKLKMKRIGKNVLVCALSLCCSAALVTLTTLGIRALTRASSGQGGLQKPGLSERTEDSFGETLAAASIDAEEISLTPTELPHIPGEEEAVSYFSYRVKKGDMIGVIADKFGITQDTIISVNNIRQSRLIQIGQYLKIPSMPGIVYTVKTNGETPETIAKKYDVDATKCAFANGIKQDTSLNAGASLFVPDAELDWVTRQEINGDLFHKPIKRSYYLSSYYGWRKNPFDSSKRTYHGGMDMACPKGSSVYAALSGTVIAAGWSNVYGNYIIIQHHSGYKTLYGHLSEIVTKKGKFVYTDTLIGRVGSTGLSTGPHLHFAVYKNGKSVNPANLWR